MSVHDSGDGRYWREEGPDVDKITSLDWRELQGLKKAIRKRSEKGHADFADATVGGEHIPGCGVLGIEFTADPTAQVVAGGTDEYRGHGLVWSCDGSSGVKGCLFCSTAVADATLSGTWREVLIHPDQQWGGKDVTWTGIHQFDASVDMTSLYVHDDVSVLGHMACGSNSDVTGSQYVDSSCDVSDFHCCDWSIAGDLIVDGTAVFCGDVDISADLDVSGNISATTIQVSGIEGVVTFEDATMYNTTLPVTNGWVTVDSSLGGRALLFLETYGPDDNVPLVIKPYGTEYGNTTPNEHGCVAGYTPIGSAKAIYSSLGPHYWSYLMVMTDNSGRIQIAGTVSHETYTIARLAHIMGKT